MVLKSTFIPSYIVYRLSIIKLALVVTEFFSVELLNLIGTRANLLAMIVVGAAVPVNPNINIFGELMMKFIKVNSHAEKMGFSKVLTEIVGNSAKQNAREETAYHLAKYAVKAHRQLLVEGNYNFKLSFGENKGICKNLVLFPEINVVREFVQSPEICTLKNAIVIGREDVGKRDFVAFYHIVTDIEKGSKGEKMEILKNIKKGEGMTPLEKIKEAHPQLFKEISRQTKVDVANFSLMLPILDNLPNEILCSNLNALQDLSCVDDWADSLKTEEGKRMLTQDRLEVHLTESIVLSYALPYFRSLGEVEKILRSSFFDYTIIYKDGRVLELECKYASPELKSAKINSLKVKGAELFRAWYNTMTREFKVCRVLGQKDYREMYKVESVKEARERLDFVKK